VIEQDLRLAADRRSPHPAHDPAGDGDTVFRAHAHAELRGLAVHRDLAGLDELFHRSPRTQAGFGQALLQLHRRCGVAFVHRPARSLPWWP